MFLVVFDSIFIPIQSRLKAEFIPKILLVLNNKIDIGTIINGKKCYPVTKYVTRIQFINK